MKLNGTNKTVYGSVVEITFVLQMSSPGFGWVDLQTGDDAIALEASGQKVAAGGSAHSFRVIRRLTVESVEFPLTDFVQK